MVKTELGTAYRLFNSSAQELINTINGVIQDGKTTATEVAMVDGKYSAFNLKYGDFIANVNAANNYIQGKLNESIKEISKNIGDISYLTKALKEYTNIEGGLIQSSLLALGYTSESGFKIMSGTNGVYQSDKRGGGIASWWGGSMLDKFDYPKAACRKTLPKVLCALTVRVTLPTVHFGGKKMVHSMQTRCHSLSVRNGRCITVGI